MNWFIVIIFFLVVLFVLLVVHSLALLNAVKLFKIKRINFKKSLGVIAAAGLIGFVVALPVSLFDKGLGSFTFNVGFIAVLMYLLNKYLALSWQKLLGIFAVYAVISIVASSILSVVTSLYVARSYSVSGSSMAPTYSSGDYLLANKWSKDYSRGDIVVYMQKRGEKTRIITRIIGLPGEKVEIKNGQTLINGKILEEEYYTGETSGDISVTLANDEYFGLGDNRTSSSDSRTYGPIAESNIEGEIFLKGPDWFKRIKF